MKRSARISRVKRSVRGQEPDPGPTPPTQEGLISRKKVNPNSKFKPFSALEEKGQSPDPGGHPPGPNRSR